MRNRSRRWLAAAVTLLVLLVPAAAGASPWVLDEDTAVVSGRFYFQRAEKEFLDEPPATAFPLDGRMNATTFAIDARMGIVEDFELQLNVPIRSISYQADPVILLPDPNAGSTSSSFDFYQENVLNFSQTVTGVADVRLEGRYQFVEGAFASAFELNLKLPTGYEKPSGTFGNEPKDAETFQKKAAKFTKPENIQDDVTLGDGQVDLGAKVLAGWAFPTRTYVRLDAGYRLRLSGAGDQVVGSLQLGQTVSDRILLKAGADAAYAVETGKKIGVSVAAKDPTLPATEYKGTKNLKLRELTLDSDRLAVRGGVVIQILQDVEGTVSYSQVVWGRNIAKTTTISFGLGAKFDLTESES